MNIEFDNENSEWYSLTFYTGQEGGWSTQTHWIGFKEGTGSKVEIREASQVDPEKMMKYYTNVSGQAIIINDEDDLQKLRINGGSGVIEKHVALEILPELFYPMECVRNPDGGFRDARFAPKEWLHRAPSTRLRLKVIRRDGMKCRICGQNPRDDTNIVLHLHHIVPWSSGGLTQEPNLITLCHTCHAGLDPHKDLLLWNLKGRI